MKNMVIRLLLFFYLTSSYLSGTHLHADGLEPIDCKVHVLVKNLNSSDTTNDSFELSRCENCFIFITFSGNYFVQPLVKGFDAQAPPLS